MTSSEKQFYAIKANIYENFHSYDFTIAQLCESQGISRITLHRTLKSNTGQSATSYISEIRLREAYALLVNQNIPIKEITQKVGYKDPKYFTRKFKAKFGATPSQIRAKH